MGGLCVSLCLSVRVQLVADYTFPLTIGTITVMLTQRSLREVVRTASTTPVPPYALKQRARSEDLPSRADHLHSSFGSDSLGKTAIVVRGFLPPATHCFPSEGTPTLSTPNVTPLRPLAENFSDWFNLPDPSRWLLRTIRLGYAIQFARRPPKFHGVLTKSVQGPNTAVLRAETVPSTEMKGSTAPTSLPILDLSVLNRALLKLPFRMLTLKHILTCVRVQDWFVAIDLKDMYFHVSILPRHRPFLRFAFEGQAYHLSLSPRVFTKVAEAALSPLREMGIRILNYLDDWLILAHSDMVLNHLAQLGLRVNWEKSKLSPAQRISFLCVELDSVSISEVCGNTQMRVSGPPKTGSEAPRAHGILSRGHATGFDAHETAAALASYSSPQVGVALRHISDKHHTIVSPDTQPLDRHYVPTVSRRIIVTTDASKTGWGATCNGQAASGVWTGPRLFWHINCLELLAVLLALRRSDNTATVAYINHQGVVQHRLKSLRATHIPGEANRMADSLRVETPPPVDLFASPESTHCQLWYGLTEAPLGIDALAHSWPRGRLNLIAQTLCKVREDKEQILLVAPFWPNRTCPSLAHSSEEGPPFSGEGHNLAPAPRSLEPPPLVPGRDQEDFRDLSPSVVNTLLQARAPSTRRLYDLKWRIIDPRSCGIKSVLSFLQEGLDRHLSASTLKVHVAAISANYDLVGRSVGKHDLIIRLNPPRPHLIPSWDLAVVLQGLQQDPFEPLQSVELDALSFKTAFLTALTSIKRVGDLQALSMNSSCLEFGPADSHIVLRPRPGYVPKVPTTPFRDQVVTFQAFSSQDDDPNLTLLCPVRALRIYMERTQPFRCSEQLFVCYGGQQKGKAVSKQRVSHWLVTRSVWPTRPEAYPAFW
ncbi:hypothetical protein M9458_052640, partial [Cirrhinus mrigala]